MTEPSELLALAYHLSCSTDSISDFELEVQVTKWAQMLRDLAARGMDRDAVARTIEDNVTVVTYNDGTYDLNDTLTAAAAILSLPAAQPVTVVALAKLVSDIYEIKGTWEDFARALLAKYDVKPKTGGAA